MAMQLKILKGIRAPTPQVSPAANRLATQSRGERFAQRQDSLLRRNDEEPWDR
jgi:hypothetical protein